MGLTRASSVHLVRSNLIPFLAWDQRELQGDLNGDLDFCHVHIEVDLDVQEDDLIAILDLLTLLSVLVTREDLKVDGRRLFLDQLDFIAGFLDFSASLLSAEVRLGVHVVELDLGAVSDELTSASLNVLPVGVLLIKHLLLEKGYLLLVGGLLLLLLLKLLLVVGRPKVSLMFKCLRFGAVLSLSGDFFASGDKFSGSLSTAFSLSGLRLICNISLVEFDSLAIVFPGIKVHLGLDLEHEVAIVPAEDLCSVTVFLDVDICVCKTNKYENNTLLLTLRIR